MAAMAAQEERTITEPAQTSLTLVAAAVQPSIHSEVVVEPAVQEAAAQVEAALATQLLAHQERQILVAVAARPVHQLAAVAHLEVAAPESSC